MLERRKRKQSVNFFRELLVKRLEPLRQSIKQYEQTGLSKIGDEVLSDDLASQLYEIEKRELACCEEAIQRIEEGKFEICDDCGEKIPKARLLSLTYVTICISCQSRREAKT